MSGIYTKMTAKTDASIREIGAAIRSNISCENVGESYYCLGEVEVFILSNEKYFFRNGSYASLTVVLTEKGTNKTADVIGSGGGEGLLNISWGANSNLSNKAIEVLSRYGFS